MNSGRMFLGATALAALVAAPAAADCDPVIYHSADPNCWGQYEGHRDFTTEFEARVDRVWQEMPLDGFHMQFTIVTRQDTGQQLLFKCGWWNEESKSSGKCYDLDVGETYRVRAGHGYGYVYVRQAVEGTVSWLETTCDLPGGGDCL